MCIRDRGNIVILGALKGNVHAGCTGERSCFVFALDMQPIQIQNGDLIAKSPDEPQPKHRVRPVSYTHLDVYKRQAMNNSLAEVHPELVSEWSEKNLPLI